MGIPPSEVRALSFWEFTAMKSEWNRRHTIKEDGGEVTAPDVEMWRKREQALRTSSLAKPRVH